MKHEFKEGVLDALIAAAVLPGLADAPPSEEEISRCIQLSASSPSSEEELATLERVTHRIENMIEGKDHSAPAPKLSAFLHTAMNRKNAEEQFGDETEQALEEARRAALEKLRSQQEKGGDNDH